MFKESMPMRPEKIEKRGDLSKQDMIRRELAKEARQPYHGSYFAKMEILALALALFLSLFPTKKAAPAESSAPATAHELKKDANIQKEAKSLAQRLEQRMAEKGFKVEVSLAQQGQMGREFVVVDPEKGVKAAYDEALKNTREAKSFYREVSFTTPDGKELPLEKFIQGLGIKIDKGVYDNLSQTDYRAIFCSQEPNALDKGFIFGFKPAQVVDYQKIYEEVNIGLKDQEQTMFNDLKSVFFSESSPTDVSRFQDKVIIISDGGHAPVRVASVHHEKGSDLYMGYASYNEQLYIANSEECLKRILDARTRHLS